MRKTVATILAVAIVAVVAGASRIAHATTGIKTNCTVTAVAFDSHLYVTCASDSTQYFGYTSADRPNCSSPTTVSLDTLKIWESMFMSALLAGRPVDIYTAQGQSGCSDSGTTFIYNVLVK